MSSALIVCIGNDLAADDRVGYEIHLQLAKEELPEGTQLTFLGLGGIDLIDQLNGEEKLIVVDAVQFGVAIGTVHMLDWNNLPYMEPRPVSGHGIGVREAIEICKRIYPERVPGNTWLVGIEGCCFDELGCGLSPAVSKAIPEAVRTVLGLLR